MLTTDDADLAERLRILSLHGISKDAWKRYTKEGCWQYDLTECGFKYNMSEFAAALGFHQLAKLDAFIARRTHLAGLYNKQFAGFLKVKPPTVLPDVKSAWHLYPVQIESSRARDRVIDELRKRNIGSSVHFIPLHLMSFYRRNYGYCGGDFPVAEAVFERVVSLPLFPRMHDTDVDRVSHELFSILDPLQLAFAG
jgi:perosamine synthetase